MNIEKIYEYRFSAISEQTRHSTWEAITHFVLKQMGQPKKILDPACGKGEFLQALPLSIERWGIDLHQTTVDQTREEITFRQGNIFDIELPKGYFDGVFVSNTLEHLSTPEEVFALLVRLHEVMQPGGVLAIIGPNFKYAYREYFDCADHKICLSHLSVEEMLYGAGFRITKSIDRFLPFSFRGRLPASKLLMKIYFRIPLLWKIFGKQYLVLAQKQL